MPRFSIKDLLIATTLIATGAGMLAFILRGMPWMNVFGDGVAVTVWIVLWFVGGGIIVAGLFAPFRMFGIGFAIGVLIQLVWPALLALYLGF